MQYKSLFDEKLVLEYLSSIGEKKYRLSQINQAIYKDLIDNIDNILTLPIQLREQIKQEFVVSPISVVQDVESIDGTNKVLFKTFDDQFVESVLMIHDKRITLCISSMVGCPMKCAFCSTGTMKTFRNLEVSEIIGQVYYLNKKLKQNDERIRNVVFMGMGEPLLNYDNVIEAINILNDQKKFGIGVRHITISTCGIVPMIYKLIEDNIQVHPAISLHAPNDILRDSLMPINKKYPLEELMKAISEYIAKTNKRIFYEYIMLKGKNDSIKNAFELVDLIKGQLAHVNLIPFNPGTNEITKFKSSSRQEILVFQKILQDNGIPTTVRVAHGLDIDAACGQLAAKQKVKS